MIDIPDVGQDSSPKRFRVLSLDGGGIKGTFTASVLASLEENSGKRISDHFDLITGTSTGGIIAIALGLGASAREVLDLYLNHGPSIFPINHRGLRGWVAGHLRHLRRPKHSQEALKNAIESVVHDQRFGDSNIRLVIPAFNAVNGSIYLFKTQHHEKYMSDCRLPAVTVAMATSAAPSYFPAFTDGEGRTFVDGGVWANCPAMVGLIEATNVLGWPVENVDMLSIGTTNAPFDISHSRRCGGLVRWNKGLLDLMMEAQVAGTLGQVNLLMSGRLMRIDEPARPGRFSLDNSSEINDLRSLGEQAARIRGGDVSERFLSTPAEPFSPVDATSSALNRSA